MKYISHIHRYSDVLLNSDYELRKEIEKTISRINMAEVVNNYETENTKNQQEGKRLHKGKQAIINRMFRNEFASNNWEIEKNVFNDTDNDLAIDFWKREVGVDVAFNHRSFLGGDLLRLQAAAEVKNIIKLGVYICPTKEFARLVSPSDASSMVNFERAKWYLENFYPVFTVPVYLLGLFE